MNELNLTELSECFFLYRIAGQCDFTFIKPRDLNEAYKVQHANYDRLGKIGGWKLGGCTHASREFFNVESVYYGPIFEREIYSYKSMISIQDSVVAAFGELEIAFRLSDAISNYLLDEICIESASNYISSVSAAIEMPRLFFPINNDSLPMIVADQCLSGGLVVGDELAVNEGVLNSITNLRAELISADGTILSGSSSDLIDGPVSAFCDFLKIAQSHKLNLLPDQIISTGAFSACKKIPCNDELKANFGPLGTFSFLMNK